ncbi:MAG: aspartate aminotransferase family protein [Nitrososphaerales archaeon]
MVTLNAELGTLQSPSKIPLVRTEIPGPKSREILDLQEKLETQSVIYPKSFPIAIKRGFNSVIEDVDGNFLIDWVSGISVLNLGHSNVIRNAVSNQLADIWHTLEIPTEIRTEFLLQLKKSFPSNMQNYRTMFGISGADACETAINIAHAASGKGYRATTIAFDGAYHGVSGGIISATAGRHYRSAVYSQGFNVVRVPYPYSMWNKNYDTNFILNQLQKIVNDPSAGYDNPDSLLVEPILGEGGYVVPPDGFLKSLREFCDKYNIIMIVDEVQSGVGRTGKMWAFEWESIKPDIVCVSKAIGGGIPISLLYYREDLDGKLPTPFHLGTFRSNPLALAAGTTVLREVPKYLNSVCSEGSRLKQRFASINSPNIGEVRGRGFMVGIELVDGGKPTNTKIMMQIKHEMLRRGLMMHTCGHFGNAFRFMGALNIPREYLDTGAQIFEESLKRST